MSDDLRFSQTASAPEAAGYDVGLRNFMLGVYNNMVLGMIFTGLVSFAGLQLFFDFSSGKMALTQWGQVVYGTPLQFVVMFAPLGLLFLLAFRVQHMAPATARMWFFIYAGLVGLSLSWVGAYYTGASIAKTFFITAAAFGCLSLYGYTTKRDLSAMGTFMIMGLFGIIIASIVNIFLGSSALEFAISVIGIVVFAGLTAWDTQKIKGYYYATGGVGEQAQRASIMGALALYLDFLNMFMFLLRFMGAARE